MTPSRAVRRQRARVVHWLARAVTEALRLGAGPTEVRALASVAAALRTKAVVGLEDRGATTPPPRR